MNIGEECEIFDPYAWLLAEDLKQMISKIPCEQGYLLRGPIGRFPASLSWDIWLLKNFDIAWVGHSNGQIIYSKIFYCVIFARVQFLALSLGTLQ